MTEAYKFPALHHALPTRLTGHALLALAGQPNMGKSTLFNLLTGLNQHVGNWPGKTVEFREGTFTHGERSFQLIDLPGTYSLTANSPEETITREYLITRHPDAVIAVVSAANLERSLYLVSELISLPVPMIIALNMMDVAAQEGLVVEAHVLEAAIGVPVVPITATSAAGVDELIARLEWMLDGRNTLVPNLPEIRSDHQQVLDELLALISGDVPEGYPASWSALKLMEGDTEMTSLLRQHMQPDAWNRVQGILDQHDDAMFAIASGRYEWIARMIRAAVTQPRLGQISLTDRIDRWATHPFWGLVILAAVLGLVFFLTFTIGAPVQAWMTDALIMPFSNLVRVSLSSAPQWLSSLIAEGVIGGAGSVLSFLPIMLIFFAAFGLLEDVGYMARAAYVMDNFMHMMGLHGKSFLPIFLGFGCNVPAVMGTRVIDSRPARLLTILIAPLVPCTARMAVLAFLAPAFFGAYAALVSWGLILLSLVLLVISGVILNRILFRGERSAFIMELPLYHFPNPRTIGLLVWERGLSFVQKAGSVILALSVGIWLLSHLPGGGLENSFLAMFGRLVAPAGSLLGLDWRLTLALLTSFFAKENAVATLGVVFSAGESAGLGAILASNYSIAQGLAFLTVSLLFIPCAATVAAIRQETGSWRWTFINILFMLILSLSMGMIVYRLASLMGF